MRVGLEWPTGSKNGVSIQKIRHTSQPGVAQQLGLALWRERDRARVIKPATSAAAPTAQILP